MSEAKNTALGGRRDPRYARSIPSPIPPHHTAAMITLLALLVALVLLTAFDTAGAGERR